MGAVPFRTSRSGMRPEMNFLAAIAATEGRALKAISRELGAGAGQDVEIAFELLAVVGFDFFELDADAGAEASGGNFADGPELLVLDPEGEPDLGAFFQRTLHLDETAAEADVGDASPDPAFLAGGVDFDRERTAAARVLAALVQGTGADEIFGGGGEGE